MRFKRNRSLYFRDSCCASDNYRVLVVIEKIIEHFTTCKIFLLMHHSILSKINLCLRNLKTLHCIGERSDVSSWPMPSYYRLRLGALESCIVISYHRTDDWSICTTRYSSISFSHNLSTFQPVSYVK